MNRVWIPYCGAAPEPAEWLARWNLDPILLLMLAMASVWAIRRGKARTPFWFGMGCLVLLFVSPLCALSSALFSIRVTHHVLLTTLAAPLIIHGIRALSPPAPALWAAGYALLFWFWHAPQPYAAALSSDLAYWTMQVTLFGSALGFWASLRGARSPVAIALLLAMTVQMGLLGALITFAGAPLYAPHELSTQAWGLTPLQDQQLAGIVMWVPASGLYLAAALWTGRRMFAQLRMAEA